MSLLGTVAGIGKIFDMVKDSWVGDKLGISGKAGYSDLLKKAGITEKELSIIAAGGDMVKVMSSSVVEPVIIVSKSMYSRKDVDGIIDSAIDAYAGFYVAVFKTLVVLYDIKPTIALSLLANKGFDKEGYIPPKRGLMDLEGLSRLPIDSEAVGDKIKEYSRTIDDKAKDYLAKTITRVIDLNVNLKNTTEVIKETDKLDSAGNPIDDKSKSGSSYTFTIPLIIKANIHVVDIETITDSFEHRGIKAGFFERLIQKKIGAITTWEFLTGSDLIEEYKKKSLSADNFASYINKKSLSDLNVMNMINKHRGLNKMVVSYIVSEREMKQISEVVGYDIDNRLEKQKLMNTMLAFNITTVNTDRDIANVYISSITGFSSAPIKKLSKSGDKGNDGIEMLASALMSNRGF